LIERNESPQDSKPNYPPAVYSLLGDAVVLLEHIAETGHTIPLQQDPQCLPCRDGLLVLLHPALLPILLKDQARTDEPVEQ
jgi:hypothetical protein